MRVLTLTGSFYSEANTLFCWQILGVLLMKNVTLKKAGILSAAIGLVTLSVPAQAAMDTADLITEIQATAAVGLTIGAAICMVLASLYVIKVAKRMLA